MRRRCGSEQANGWCHDGCVHVNNWASVRASNDGCQWPREDNTTNGTRSRSIISPIVTAPCACPPSSPTGRRAIGNDYPEISCSNTRRHGPVNERLPTSRRTQIERRAATDIGRGIDPASGACVPTLNRQISSQAQRRSSKLALMPALVGL